MTWTDYAVIAGLGLIAAGFTLIGSAIRAVAIGVDETIGYVERRRKFHG